MYSDTDAFFVSTSKDNLDDCVPQHLRSQYCREKRVWLPAEPCNDCRNSYIQTRSNGVLMTRQLVAKKDCVLIKELWIFSNLK